MNTSGEHLYRFEQQSVPRCSHLFTRHDSAQHTLNMHSTYTRHTLDTHSTYTRHTLDIHSTYPGPKPTYRHTDIPTYSRQTDILRQSSTKTEDGVRPHSSDRLRQTPTDSDIGHARQTPDISTYPLRHTPTYPDIPRQTRQTRQPGLREFHRPQPRLASRAGREQ